MWWIIGVVVLGVIIFRTVNKDYKESVHTNVTRFGGMEQKYKTLVLYFTQHPASRIAKLTNDSITISSSTINVRIDSVGGSTEIYLDAIMPIVGKISNKWKFQQGYPQERMIEDIENFLEWKMEQFKKIIDDE